jgi:hypothetical protein
MEMKPLLVLAALAALTLGALHYYAPLQAGSVCAWTGVLLALGGLLNLARPWRWLGIRTRLVAAGVALAGLALVAFALSWPVERRHVPAQVSQLDAVMAEFDFDEHHEVLVAAPPERVMAAVRASTESDIAIADALMRVRAFAYGKRLPPADARVAERPILDQMTRPGGGFVRILDTPTEIVAGMAGRPWANQGGRGVHDADTWRAFHEAGSIRVAFNLRAEAAGNGQTRLLTETRIQATDDDARRRMARYWRLIYPGSGIIRRVWLNAIAARATAG